MNGMRRCALVLLLAFASCSTVSRKTSWRGKALVMYEQYLADNPDLSAERKLLLSNNEMKRGVTTLKDYLLLYHLRYGRPQSPGRGMNAHVLAHYEGSCEVIFWDDVFFDAFSMQGGATTYFRTPEVEPGWPE